jgi:uncharacterized protein
VSIYVDASALVKQYVAGPDSNVAEELLASDPILVTGRHTIVEVRRNLARLLGEPGAAARAAFADDVEAIAIVELDEQTCDAAAGIVEMTGVRTLDALHLAAARRVGGATMPFLTFDLRQAQAARTLGFTVLGA